MMIGKRFLAGGVALACLFAGSVSLRAQTSRDVDFSDKLNEMQLYDYAEFFLRDLLKQDLKNPERVQVLLMDTLLRQNKIEDSKKIFNSISKNTENYYHAEGVYGVYYFSRNPDEALKHLLPLLDFWISTKQNPDDWKQPTAALFNLLKNKGMTKENEKLLQWFQGGGEQDERSKLYTQCLLKLDTIENGILAETTALSAFNAAVDDAKEEVAEDNDKKTALANLLAAREKAKNAYIVSLRGKSVNLPALLAGWVNTDKKLEQFVKFDFEKIRKYEIVIAQRDANLKLFLARNTKSPKELAVLKTGNPDDWQANLFMVMFDLENIQWGGQDVATASAAALSARGYFILKQYDLATREVKKFKDLFNGCDELLDKEGQIETSPGADAKVWEGRSYYELAKKAARENKQQDAIKNYKRAFKTLGTLLKTYPKHRDGAKNFVIFLDVIDELSALEPSLAAKLHEERAKVPAPAKGGSAEEEKLLTPTSDQNFRDKNYAKVVEELFPILVEKRTSSGAPELLDRLIICQILTKDYLNALALADYMAALYPDSQFTIHALKTSGSLIWKTASDLEKEVAQEKTASTKAVTSAKSKNTSNNTTANDVVELKNIAVDFFNRYLKIGIDDQDAAPAALQLAREYYNRAQKLGKQLNAETDQEVRASLKNDWLLAYDKVIANYQFIIDHFGNRAQFVDEAYIYQSESYVTTERYDKAAETFRRFCAAGSENKSQLALAKLNISDMLNRLASNYEKNEKAIREEAAAIFIPTIPAAPEPPKQPEPSSASAPATPAPATPAATPAPATPAATPAPATPAATPDGDPAKDLQAAYKKELADYEAALKEIEMITADAKIQKAKKDKMESEAVAEEAKAKAVYQEAIDNLLELMTKWIAPGSEFYAKISSKPETAKTIERATALLPWLYDGIGDKEKAIAAFDVYISKYPKAKDIPAYMMRIGMLYTEIGKDTEAQKVLSELSTKYPDSPQGKNANFFLARNLYENGSYVKAIPLFKQIFGGPLLNNLSVSNLRWVSSNLSDCPSAQFGKDFAGIAIQASQKLVEKLKKPEFKEWVGDLKAIEFSKDKAASELYKKQLEQKLQLEVAKSASLLGKYDDAVKSLTRIIELDENTAYYNEVYFGRSEAYRNLKKFDLARKDLTRIGSRAMIRTKGSKQPNYGLYNKSQVLVGEIFLEEKEPAKAYAMFSMVASPAFSNEATTPVKSDDPKDDSYEYVERAIYRAAYTAALTGKEAEKVEMTAKYKKHYPKGKFIGEIDNLPSSSK